jgi:hypothetical protein
VARGSRPPARGREGAHPPQRRARPPAPGAAVGAGRARLPLRHRTRRADAGGPVRRPLAAARAPLHVRPRLGRRLPELFVGGRRVRRLPGAPRAPRRRPVGGVACAAGPPARVSAPHGLDLPVGVVGTVRLQTSTSACRTRRTA